MILWLGEPQETSILTGIQQPETKHLFSIHCKPQNFIDFNEAWNLIRDQEVEGSNPFAPTNFSSPSVRFLVFRLQS